MTRGIWVISLLALATSSGRLIAQSASELGNQSGTYARWAEAKSTKPKIISCYGDVARCFRVMIQVTPLVEDEIGIGRTDERVGFFAFTASGQRCEGRVKSGLDSQRARLNRKWHPERLVASDKRNKAIIVAEFECENSLIVNEEITFQVTLDYYIDPNRFGEARYIFQNSRLSK